MYYRFIYTTTTTRQQRDRKEGQEHGPNDVTCRLALGMFYFSNFLFLTNIFIYYRFIYETIRQDYEATTRLQ